MHFVWISADDETHNDEIQMQRRRKKNEQHTR